MGITFENVIIVFIGFCIGLAGIAGKELTIKPVDAWAGWVLVGGTVLIVGLWLFRTVKFGLKWLKSRKLKREA